MGGDKLDIGGAGGKFTYFKVHKIGGGECKLESCEFPGKYIAVGKNNVPRVGGGGPFCKLKVLRQWFDLKMEDDLSGIQIY